MKEYVPEAAAMDVRITYKNNTVPHEEDLVAGCIFTGAVPGSGSAEPVQAVLIQRNNDQSGVCKIPIDEAYAKYVTSSTLKGFAAPNEPRVPVTGFGDNPSEAWGSQMSSKLYAYGNGARVQVEADAYSFSITGSKASNPLPEEALRTRSDKGSQYTRFTGDWVRTSCGSNSAVMNPWRMV